jgi:Bifunctional DNA primase/polymerase, N-terminal/Primase C terminal 2 (PriCT-2)/AAA domain
MNLVGAKAVSIPESRLDYALRYVALGWHVLPLHWITDKGLCSCGNKGCKNPGKHPTLKTGLKEASTDTRLLNYWFGKKWPKANIGIATGAVSGIFALDIDPRHNGDDSLDAIRSKYGVIPDDVLAITGSGGNHFLFQHPAQVGRSTTNIWPGIDTRGDGGYIVVAPSNHISGQVYFWDAEADPLNGAILPPCPDWLLAKLAEKSQPTPNTPTTDKLLPPNEVKRLRIAIGYISADNRDQWLQVGMALHASGAGKQAFGLWCEWSQQSEKYDFADSRRVWGSFKPDGGINLASIFGIAKTNGWIPPNSERPPEPPLVFYTDDVLQTLPTPPSGEQTTLFTLIPASELTAHPVQILWILYNFLEAGSLNLLFGEPGAAKSLIALEWCFCIALGLEWP